MLYNIQYTYYVTLQNYPRYQVKLSSELLNLPLQITVQPNEMSSSP